MPTASFDDILKGYKLDDRLTLCHLWQKAGGSVAGFVEMPQYREVLKAHGFDVSAVKLLPEESSTSDRFGIVTVDHTLLRKTPEDLPGDQNNASDLMHGETVFILDRKSDGWTLVHANDGYLGWVPSEAIGLVLPAKIFGKQLETAQRHLASQATIRNQHVGFATPSQFLVDGPTTQPAVAVGVALEQERAMHAREAREDVIHEAMTFVGTRYVCGGKTNDGIDCSGLTQTCFARQCILLPRDADEQSNVGRLVGTRWFEEALLPADLLFFVSPERGKVHHVAIYLGAGRYIEAAGKDVHERSMTPGDADYDAERAATFGWARRVIE